MTKSIIILTGDSLRHDYMRKSFGLAEGIEVLRTYRETARDTLLQDARDEGEEIRITHLERRSVSEHDFFASFVEQAPDESNPIDIPKGEINDREHYEEIVELDPDLLVTYGSSIIGDPLLSEYEDRFLNCHLGLSPYYRGTGTNFWPLVNGEPEYVGATFHYLVEEIDAGEIIHQLRARVYPNDGPHDIGYRLVTDACRLYPEIVRQFDSLHSVEQPSEPDESHYYRSSDYNSAATQQLYDNFADGMIDEYLENYDERVAAVPIVKHSSLDEDDLVSEPDLHR